MTGLLLAPVERSAIYFGKVAANLLYFLIVEALLAPTLLILFDVNLARPMILLGLFLGTLGYAIVGTLFAALTVRSRARGSAAAGLAPACPGAALHRRRQPDGGRARRPAGRRSMALGRRPGALRCAFPGHRAPALRSDLGAGLNTWGEPSFEHSVESRAVRIALMAASAPRYPGCADDGVGDLGRADLCGRRRQSRRRRAGRAAHILFPHWQQYRRAPGLSGVGCRQRRILAHPAAWFGTVGPPPA